MKTTLKSALKNCTKVARLLLFSLNHLYFCALFWGVILMSGFKDGADALFILLGAIMILAMHAGFAFLELGTVRKKNQVNALVKILVDFACRPSPISSSATALPTASISSPRPTCWPKNGYELVKFFFLLTFAADPGHHLGRHRRAARFHPQTGAGAAGRAGLPFFEGIAWNHRFGVQDWLLQTFGAEFHDFAGSVVVHAVGGWIALPAVLLLGARRGRYMKNGGIAAHPPSSIPFLALGAWILMVGWFGFNVMSAQALDKMNGLVAVNSLMAMVGGTLVALSWARTTPALPQRPAGRPGGGVRRLRPDASAGRAGHRRHRRRHVRLDVHAGAEQMEDRRRAGRVAAARPVRRVGRHRGRHLRPEGAGWRRRRVDGVAADGTVMGVAIAAGGTLSTAC
jgi:hypothetical protein